MHITLVHIHVKPEHVEDFITATRKNHEGARQEPGNIRFDVLQQDDDASRFVLYEVFSSPDDAAKHKETDHYLTWRETVADWMASPRQGIQHRVHCPATEAQW